MGGAAHALKRIPRIKFPQRHPNPSGSTSQHSQHQATSASKDAPQTFFSSSTSKMSVGGKASDQPKRTPVSQEEIDSIMLGGCF
nr:amyloid beta A4 precursor protein-binding family B member 1-interacting protein [Ipomoea batatas]GMD95679.1 amyloid beta A4 precursor protein-binding family B member 1-interacting protein [Ipomoea batatas]GME04003.1 amyloid beta A4 precursor protein-binding family B member 1-interacting protein [Ipomoea batatas]